MSQASKSHVQSRIRWREQAARIIARDPAHFGVHLVGVSAGCDDDVQGLLDGDLAFDVARVRAHADRMIFGGERASETWAVFVDWCRDQGLGPESCRSGWPGDLTAAWARGPGRVECPSCDNPGTRTLSSWRACVTEAEAQQAASEWQAEGHVPEVEANPDSNTYPWRVTAVRHVPCDACDGAGLVEGPRPQPGDAQIRMGRRLLAAIDGQPNSCQHCIGLPQAPPEGHTYLRRGTPATSGVYYVHSLQCPCGASENETMVVRSDCAHCHGTSNNLDGFLPPARWPAAVYRKVSDSAGHNTENRASWCSDLADELGPHPSLWGPTRVAHRAAPPVCIGFIGGRVGTIDERITDRERWPPNAYVSASGQLITHRHHK